MALNQDVAFKISAEVTGQSAVDKLSESLKRLGMQGEMSGKQWTAAMRMVPAQLTDIATQLAGGQSPFLIMMQQGGQLRDMFGSVTGALVAVGRTIAGVVTPVNAVVAAFAAVGYAAYRGNQDFVDLTNKMTLTGNAAGYTTGQIEKMARALSNSAGISAGTARDLTAGLASTGQFVGKNLDIAEQAAARVQKLTGQTAEEVVKDFANMSKNVAGWAAEHNRSFNYITAAEFQHIKALEEMGDKEGAMRANMEALNKAFGERKQQLGYIEELWKGITSWASKGWAAMLNIGKPETNEDRLDKLKQQLEGIEKLANRPMAGGLQGAERASYDARRQAIIEQMRLLQRGIDKENDDALTKAKAAAKEREKIDKIQSGELNAVQNASIQVRLEKLKGASEQEIALLEQKGQRIENEFRKGAISEEQYNADKLNIAKAVLNERMKLAEQEIALEQQRPGGKESDGLQRQAKVQALRNELARLGAEATQAELKAEGERAAFLRQMNDEVAKFSRTQQARIDQIKAEADASGMSTLEYKKHTEALRIDREAADAAKGKSSEFVAAIMAEAEAQKKATAAALNYANQKATSFDSGAKAAMKDYVENTANAANQAKNLFTNAFKGMEDALVNFVKTGKLDFASLADSIITDMIRIAVQRQILGPLMGTGVGGDYGIIGSLFGFANGGIMSGSGALPLQKYANGGVARKPQMAVFGEGSMPEAFVPLPDGRRIPVAMQGAQGGSNVTVNVVNNAGGAQASAHERQDSNGNRIIDVVIEQVKASIAADISRGVGTVTSALEKTYGANRAAGAY